MKVPALKRLLLGCLVMLLLLGCLMAWYLFPGQSRPVRVDVVVVLAGVDDGRHALGAELVKAGVAENLVISNPAGTEDVVGSSYCRGKRAPVEAAGTWCMNPDPVTTIGEALTFGQLAAEQGWSSVAVVTNRPHTRRVRMMFRECTDLDSEVVHIKGVDWAAFPTQMIHEIGGHLKYRLFDSCVS